MSKQQIHTNVMASSGYLGMRLWRDYLRKQAGRIAWAMLLMVVASAMTGAMAKLIEPIIDKVFSEKNSAMLVPVGMSVFIVFILRGLATYGHVVLMNLIAQRTIADMQRAMFSHLVYADVAFFHGQQSGQLMSRFIADMNMIRTALNETLTGAGKNTLTLIFLISVMFIQDWKLSVFSILVFPAAAYAMARLGKKLRKVATNMQVQTGDLSGMLGQAFQGNRHIKAYGTEEFEKTRINKLIENIFGLMNKSFRVSAVAAPIAEILSGLAVVVIVIYGGYQVMAGVTTTGKLFSFITAFMLAFEPMKRLAKLNNVIQIGFAALDRFFKMVDAPPDIQNKPGAGELNVTSADIIFDHVFFRYADGTEALKGISFTAPAGKTVALVGESGGGKSTILNLIPRFYDVTEGSVSISGHDIRDVTLESLRANMAFVSQDAAVFSDTVRENICYGTPHATEDQVIEAAKAANAHDFILELPQGYNTKVGENGVKLSGGQRQRIAIARAMLRNAPVLLLDEATSALDAHAERLVQSALERLEKGKTTIVVAHRLSTIINADIIYVLQHGRIAESGTHASLIAKNGAYSRLYSTFAGDDKETAA